MNSQIIIAALFHRIMHALDTLAIPYQAFEDHSIRLLGPAPQWITDLLTILHAING
jgi:hypothetical protein